MADLYEFLSTESTGSPNDPIPPGTVFTASVETIDNDRAAVLLGEFPV
ncbi:MAG: hypothetical protein QM711_03760 [Micropruina sp.]